MGHVFLHSRGHGPRFCCMDLVAFSHDFPVSWSWSTIFQCRPYHPRLPLKLHSSGNILKSCTRMVNKKSKYTTLINLPQKMVADIKGDENLVENGAIDVGCEAPRVMVDDSRCNLIEVGPYLVGCEVENGSSSYPIIATVRTDGEVADSRNINCPLSVLNNVSAEFQNLEASIDCEANLVVNEGIVNIPEALCVKVIDPRCLRIDVVPVLAAREEVIKSHNPPLFATGPRTVEEDVSVPMLPIEEGASVCRVVDPGGGISKDNLGAIGPKNGRPKKIPKKLKQKQVLKEWNNFCVDLGDIPIFDKWKFLAHGSAENQSSGTSMFSCAETNDIVVGDLSNDDKSGALERWNLGKDIGFYGIGDEDVIVNHLVNLEARDKLCFEESRRRTLDVDDNNLH
ncbi:unnamed protein product [Lupinus luteus]|uniref:Uncharacterized protein n=1 Tax=Lupinus luteus TaxID=3873 RepID=A0AAV1XGJ5_LUPLU